MYRPSAAMSCVADAIATRPSIAMLDAKNAGRFSVEPSTSGSRRR
jgi:hypothetical protein